MCVRNPQNENFSELHFYCGKMLINIQQIYCKNDDIVERLNNGSIVDICMNQM